jgi:hypothetical protein
MYVRACVLLLMIGAAPLMASPMYMYDDISSPETRTLQPSSVNASVQSDQVSDIDSARNTSVNSSVITDAPLTASPKYDETSMTPEVRPLQSGNMNATALRDQMFGIGPPRSASGNYSAITAVDNFDCEGGEHIFASTDLELWALSGKLS